MASTAYAPDSYLDLVAMTRPSNEPGWADIAKSLRNHAAMEMILDRANVDFAPGGRQAITFNVQHRHTSASAFVKSNQVITAQLEDYMTTGSVPWRICNTHWAVDEMQELMNKGPEQIVNLTKVKRYSAYTDLADRLEAAFWTAPSSSSDELQPYGAPYYLTRVGVAATPGHNGTVASGHTTTAGISHSTYTGWRNWVGQYTAVTKPDLVTKMREAVIKTSFRPPYAFQATDGSSPSKRRNRYRIFTNYDVLRQFEDMLENQNENLGNDLAPKDGVVMFRGTPVVYCDYLEQNDSTDPVYGFNFDAWKIVWLRGQYMREQAPIRMPNQPMTIVTHVWNVMNFVCRNRREGGFVLYV